VKPDYGANWPSKKPTDASNPLTGVPKVCSCGQTGSEKPYETGNAAVAAEFGENIIWDNQFKSKTISSVRI
jgi:hypothetical protein